MCVISYTTHGNSFIGLLSAKTSILDQSACAPDTRGCMDRHTCNASVRPLRPLRPVRTHANACNVVSLESCCRRGDAHTPTPVTLLFGRFSALLVFFCCGNQPDVRKLLPEGLLDDARAQEVAKAYNAQEGVIVEVRGLRCSIEFLRKGHGSKHEPSKLS